MSVCSPSWLPLSRRLRDSAWNARLWSGRLCNLLIIAREIRILLYRSWPTINDCEVVHFNGPVMGRVASVLVLVLEILVLDECLLRTVLLLAFVGDLLVLSWDYSRLQLVHFLC